MTIFLTLNEENSPDGGLCHALPLRQVSKALSWFLPWMQRTSNQWVSTCIAYHCIVLSICQIFRPATVDMGHKDRVPGCDCCPNADLRLEILGTYNGRRFLLAAIRLIDRHEMTGP